MPKCSPISLLGHAFVSCMYRNRNEQADRVRKLLPYAAIGLFVSVSVLSGRVAAKIQPIAPPCFSVCLQITTRERLKEFL
jgi:hypothetical protein